MSGFSSKDVRELGSQAARVLHVCAYHDLKNLFSLQYQPQEAGIILFKTPNISSRYSGSREIQQTNKTISDYRLSTIAD